MNKRVIRTSVLVLALPAVGLTGCASSHEMLDEEFASARTSIELAEQSGAREFAPASLERARERLSGAELALERGDEELALRLLAQAELDAELAAAQADRGKADEALAEVNDSIDDLRREIDRNRSGEDH
ncbi:MAG: DUF4398 domain-containing protein [Xanthomonadales bacterium]|nr:DUF4398 domain-containing protein [Xanthomonadales bacterium]